MSWLFLAALGILWIVFLLPSERGRHSPHGSVEGFERDMELLADTERSSKDGRWIITPKKGTRFLGTKGRERARARQRRRGVFVFLLESIVISFLIGVVPPLRALWYATAILAGLLAVYVWALIAIRAREPARPVRKAVEAVAMPPEHAEAPFRRARGYASAADDRRYAAQAAGNSPRPTVNGLGSVGEDDPVHVVVLPAAELEAARA